MIAGIAMKTYLTIMLGGAIGTGARLWLSGCLAARFGEAFPVGTLVVNVTGSFIIGLFAVMTGPDGVMPAAPLVRQGVMIGVLGGFTTFSAFSLQTLHLGASGEWMRAGWNIALSLGLCLVAVWLGHLVASAFNHR